MKNVKLGGGRGQLAVADGETRKNLETEKYSHRAWEEVDLWHKSGELERLPPPHAK